MSSLQIHPIPAFTDNYIWCLHDGHQAVVVDPGDASPVQRYLQQHSLALTGILVTHHHPDHVAGIAKLVEQWPGIPVWGPAKEHIPALTQALQQGDRVRLAFERGFSVELRVIEVPGHTLGHIAYFAEGQSFGAGASGSGVGVQSSDSAVLSSGVEAQSSGTLPPSSGVGARNAGSAAPGSDLPPKSPDTLARSSYTLPQSLDTAVPSPGFPLLFCGDTLFSSGCGRLFEGTPEQMFASLDQLRQLPAATRVYCTHEYTLSNLKFALAVEPDNAELHQRQAEVERLRAAQQPSLPSNLALERQVNPFLRTDQPAVVEAVTRNCGTRPASEAQTFARLRAWKDHF